MTRVDFYVLASSDIDSRLLMVCKLAEKALHQQQPVFIHADDEKLLELLDQLLWSFREDSFVPHSLLARGTLASSVDADPVQLSAGEPAADRRVLINLASDVPAFFSRCERTLEVVNQAEAVRAGGRERYRYYQQRGYPLQHHKM